MISQTPRANASKSDVLGMLDWSHRFERGLDSRLCGNVGRGAGIEDGRRMIFWGNYELCCMLNVDYWCDVENWLDEKWIVEFD